MKKFTSMDIARLANVSSATVSRVLNNSPLVREKTRKKVKQIITQVNYQPNAIAKSLVTKKTGMIGILVWDLATPFSGEVVKMVGKECRKRNYQPIFCSTERKKEIEAEYLNLLMNRDIEGLLIGTAQLQDPQIEKLIINVSLPIVLIDRRLRTDLASYVAVDYEKGSCLAVKHLIKKHGHKRIACIAGLENSSSSIERIQGYKKALHEENIPIDPQLIIPGTFLRESGYKAAQKIFSLKKRPTAIFSSNDYMALGALDFFYNKGIKIPKDLALIGFDNDSFSSLSFIQLSTINPRRTDIIKYAINILFKKISDPDDKTIYTKKIIPELVIRKSCGCL